MHQNEIWLTSLQMPMLLFIGAFHAVYAMASSQKIKCLAVEKEIPESLLEKIVPTFHFDANKQIDARNIANSELPARHNPFVKDKSRKQFYNMNQGVLFRKIGIMEDLNLNTKIWTKRCLLFLQKISFNHKF